MEAVGARLGRSSSRYGTTTVFNGPVRKWKKKWVHVAPPSNHHNSAHSNHHSSLANGNSNPSSHLLLYKWTPITQSNKENNGNPNSNGDNKNPSSKEDGPDSSAAPAPETPPRRKFRYIPKGRCMPAPVMEENMVEWWETEIRRGCRGFSASFL